MNIEEFRKQCNNPVDKESDGYKANVKALTNCMKLENEIKQHMQVKETKESEQNKLQELINKLTALDFIIKKKFNKNVLDIPITEEYKISMGENLNFFTLPRLVAYRHFLGINIAKIMYPEYHIDE